MTAWQHPPDAFTEHLEIQDHFILHDPVGHTHTHTHLIMVYFGHCNINRLEEKKPDTVISQGCSSAESLPSHPTVCQEFHQLS